MLFIARICQIRVDELLMMTKNIQSIKINTNVLNKVSYYKLMAMSKIIT